MKGFWMALALFAAASVAFAAETPAAPTALEALKLLPPGKAARIAWIEGRGGVPQPDQWYLIVQDEFDENGVHEYVVASGGIIASRSLSQFVTSLLPEDIVGADAIKVDSSRAGRITGEYAAANGLKFSTLNFQLKKDGGQPVWKVTCLDSAGVVVGEVTLDAAKGTVVSHDGFAIAPAPARAPSRPAAEPKAEPRSAAVDKKKKRHLVDQPAPVAEAPPEAPVFLTPAPPPPRNPGLFERIGGSLSHILPGQ
jgi:hypothetical protein